MMRRAGWPVRVALLAMALLWLVVGAAAPATAHSVGGAQASNYQTRIRAVEPPVAGLRVEVVDAGARLRLHNATGPQVVVLGDADEPYLRVGPAGVFENRRSPATYRNRVRTAPAPAPASADPAAPPEWRRLGAGDAVAWYDHRAHWMEPSDAPAVRAAPDRSHLVIPSWQVDLRVGGQPVRVTGEVRWVPGPDPWPSVAGWALAVVAVRRLLGPDPERAGVYLLLSAVILVMVGGLGDLDSLSSSQLASSLPPWVTRALVAATLGLGGGLAVVGLHWSQPPAARSRRRGPAAQRGAP